MVPTPQKMLIAADMEYMSARLAYMHGYWTTAAHLATRSVELYLKTLCILQGVKFPTAGSSGHSIKSLFSILKVHTDPSLDSYVLVLESGFSERYPDTWSENKKWGSHLPDLDHLVRQARNEIIAVMNERNLTGSDILKAAANGLPFPSALPQNVGTMKHGDVFRCSNQSAADFVFLK